MYILGAHMDGRGGGEAANDDGSGTAFARVSAWGAHGKAGGGDGLLTDGGNPPTVRASRTRHHPFMPNSGCGYRVFRMPVASNKAPAPIVNVQVTSSIALFARPVSA